MTPRLVATVVAAVYLPAAAQYKCVTPGGVSFQQMPCSGTARSQKLDLAPSAPADPAGARAAAESTRRMLAAAEWQSAVNQAIMNGYPLVGMSIVDLDRALGAPNSLNTSDHGRGREEQRTYYRGTRTFYVYIRAGIVTAVQNTAGGDPALAARQACPSRQELDNEAARLSSIGIGPAEREDGQRRLARLRRECL